MFGPEARVRVLDAEDLEVAREQGLADEEEERQHGVSRELLETASRHAEATKGLPREKRRARLTGWLLRRGHNWDTINLILQRLDLR